MNKGLLSITALLAAGVIFVGVNVLAGAGLRGARVDLTEGHLYTLSEGSRNIAKSMGEPITLTLYYSEKQSNQLPAPYKSYGARVKEVLEEYKRASGGKITLEIIDPEPFSAAEDKAVAAELLAAPVGRGGGGAGAERFFFGLVGVNSTDRQEKVPFFRPEREEFLEYDLTRLIYLLSEPKKKTVGVMSWLPIMGDSGGANPMMRQQPTPAWIVVNQMRDVFDVKTIENTATEIPADINVLMVVHPKKAISDATVYAIDQFVLRGGRAVVFVDPLCEADVPPGVNPMQAMQIPKDSGLPKLFDAWGIEMAEGQFAADRESAVKVQVGSAGKPDVSDYIAYIQLNEECIDKDDPITGQATNVFFATAGVLKKKGDVGTTITPLVQTSKESQALPTSSVSFMPDPKKLLAEFKSGDAPLTIAARVTGKVKTAFPDGRPGPPPPRGNPGEPPPPAPVATPDPNFVSESKEPINVVVVADCDMLTDRFWVNEERIGNIVLGYRKYADNGDLAINAVDNLSGSSDLISVRARGKFARPFDRVVQMEKDAQKKFAEEEQKLEAKLQETQQKINQLQRERTDAKGSAAFFLTPEQEAQVAKFRAEELETKKQLRQVKHSLRKDIDNLGTRLKFVNVGLMPIVVGVAAVGLGLWRASRRRADRWKPKLRD